MNTLIMDGAAASPLEPFGIKVDLTSDIARKSLCRSLLLSLAQEHKLVLFRGLPILSREELLRVCADDPQTELLHWSFGRLIPQSFRVAKQSLPPAARRRSLDTVKYQIAGRDVESAIAMKGNSLPGK